MSIQLKRCAVAYMLIFLNFNFNFNNFTIAFLPDILGWFILLKVIDNLKEEQKTLELLKVPCIVLMICSLTQFVPNLLLNFTVINIFVSLAVTLFSLYFHFQFISDIGSILEKYGIDKMSLYKCRNVLTIAVTLTQLIRFWNYPWIFVPVFVIGVLAGLATTYTFYKYSKYDIKEIE